MDGYESDKTAAVKGASYFYIDDSESVVVNENTIRRKRTASLDIDLLDLERLGLSDDITTRRRLFDVRCVKRNFLNRRIIFTKEGFIIDNLLKEIK